KKLGMPEDQICYYDATKNWWSRAGTPDRMPAGEPGGPDSEVFYEFTQVEHDPKFGAQCHPNCDCGRFLEIGNSVFMQYIKQVDDSFGPLPKQNVDFGGGLERIAAAKNNEPDIFKIDIFVPLIAKLESWSGKKYTQDMRSFRIVADHIRAASMLIGDGVMPGSTERGYVVRRLIRRAVRFADKLGVPAGKLAELTNTPAIAEEENRFRKTLERGLREFARFAGDGIVSAQDAFDLVTTYGFPLELILEEAGERGIKQIDVEGFKELLKKHQDTSRAGSEQKFKGGLADTSEKTTRLHTAHHLLLKALQMVLGPEVRQRGSNITQERLRIDFNYRQKMTDEQKRAVEKIVNGKIKEDVPVVRTEMSREEAEKLGAEHEFGAKYPERVSIYSVGPLDSAFSIEFCGGPHVEHTGAIGGTFKIQKEEAVAAGIRRIKAVIE
ncbi:MAG: alanine--tRNA ligase, partial [Patescibacteria group bacterium]|nr:alanine--tRNA ligase [Patescibacteria group bacterium]